MQPIRPRSVASFLSALLASLLCLPGCTSPKTRVAKEAEKLQLEWQTNLALQARLPERTLDWSAAVAQVRAANLKLRQARTELTNAHEAVRQVFRDLVTTLNVHAGLSKRVVDLPDVSPNDITFNADSFFNIPGLASFGARLYVTRLAELRAEAACSLVEREQLVELYKVFWAAQETQLERRFLQSQKSTAEAFAQIDPFTSQLLLTEAEVRQIAGDQESQSLQQRVADILGSRDYRWVLTTNGLPQFHYDTEPLPLNDTNRVAQLQLRLAAIESEAARAALAGIKLRYWPELNIFVTGPPLYQRAFGQERWWSAKDVRASADVFWWVDTRGYISRQLRQTKRQQDLQRERLRQESIALMQKLMFTQDLLTTIRDKKEDLEQQLQVLDAVPPAQNYAALQRYATDYQTTADQLRQVQRQLAELNALFWFVDENAWAQISPMKPLAAATPQR